jgi:hypothetical protein
MMYGVRPPYPFLQIRQTHQRYIILYIFGQPEMRSRKLFFFRIEYPKGKSQISTRLVDFRG